MDSWHHFLQQQVLQQQETNVTDDQANTILLFDLDGITGLQLRNGALEGGSHKLLQGQLTCDLDKLTSTSSLFGAHCTPKGRALANFHVLQDDNSVITLVMPSDQLENATAGLNKYAPFFTVALENSPARVLGLAGPEARTLCQQVMGTAPQESGQSAHGEYGSALCLDQHRLLLLIAPEHFQPTWEKLTNSAKTADQELWQLLDIRAGIGHIRAATSEEFIPQMLNMQASHGKNGAISFKKGCYTGQEVVARMHYLGKLKRRMYRLQIPQAEIAIGNHCYLPDKPQSQGDIVSVARSGKDAMELLAVLTEKAAASDQLTIGASPENAYPVVVEQLPLPYSLDI